MIPELTGHSVLRPSPPPVVGGGDDNNVDWVARGLLSSGEGSIVASTLRRPSASLSPLGGDRGGEAHRVPGRGEEDEYRGRKVQGGVDEAQHGWDEEEGGSVSGWADGPGGGGRARAAGNSDGRELYNRALDAPPSHIGEGGLSSCHLSIVMYP